MIPACRKFIAPLFFLVSLWNPAPGNAQAIPSGGKIIKYLNPIHEKSYTNEAQDRQIKKKSFKSASLEGAKAVPNREIGLFATIDNEKLADQDYIKQVLDKPEVNGIACLLSWKQIEPKEDVYNWSVIDALLSACQNHQKLLILRISTCGIDSPDANDQERSDTPKWVFDAGTKSITYTGHDGKEHLMPVFWDTTYLAKWSNFIHDLGDRYDKNPSIHSIGITGGGVRGSTAVVPNLIGKKENYDSLEEKLKKDFGMSPRQIVGHWKYVADLFPKVFPNARLNFDIDPPTPNRSGQDCLDEISDYLVFRYGERVYLTRQNIVDDKHGFDQYRVLLKFKADTPTGYQIAANAKQDDLKNIAKNALDDSVSFAEIPAQFFLDNTAPMTAWLNDLREHLGYQLVAQKVELPINLAVGEPLKASFTFVNLGSAPPLKPSRYLDKDRAGSYKVQLEIRDESGKPVVLSLHTPTVPTNRWLAGKPVRWEEELKMPKLTAGKYSVWMSLVDADSKRKLNLLDATKDQTPQLSYEVPVGNIQVTQ
ncbi:MAG: hypothetical protein C5B53_12420 [Candidatus Melainabacteria bacterium]|nr:MAG: hypothetical protein C5B53_12420 [Candidatus Melainabacteria bacterium]